MAKKQSSANQNLTASSSSVSYEPVPLGSNHNEYVGTFPSSSSHGAFNDEQPDSAAIRRVTSNYNVETVQGEDGDRSINGSSGDQPLFLPNGEDGVGKTKDYWQYFSYYIPVTSWFPKYNVKQQLLRDCIAGLSVGAMITPQSMAYASILNLPPINGLVTALFANLIYFFLGHSPVLTVGPEATTSILLGEAILNLPEIKAAKEAGEDITGLCYAAASSISFLCGIVTLLFGVFRLGFVDGVFSRPVLAGFICAVGGLLLLDQTPKIMGIPTCSHCETTPEKLKWFWEKVFLEWNVNYCSIIIGVSCVLFLFGFKFIKAKYPESVILSRTPHIFIMVLAATFISYLADLEGHYGISVIGNKNSSFPAPKFPTIFGTNFQTYLTTAIILAVLGFVETQLVNKTIQLPNTTVSPNRELVALGAIHTIASMFGGYAAFGSLTRTRVSMSAGTTSQIANLVALAIILISIFALMPFFAYLPNAVTAGIVWYVATSLLETHETIFTFQTKQWLDFCLNLAMIGVTFFMGVDIGLFFAFAICLLLVIKQQNKPSVRLLGRFGAGHGAAGVDTVDEAAANTTQGDDGDEYIEFNETAKLHQSLEGILIYQIDGPLFFCNAENLKDRMRRIEMFGSVQSHPSQPAHPLDLRAIVFDLQSVTSIDATAAAVLLELVEDYKKRSIRVVLVKLRKNLLPLLVDAGIVAKLGMENFKRSVNAAVEHIEQQEKEDENNSASATTDGGDYSSAGNNSYQPPVLASV